MASPSQFDDASIPFDDTATGFDGDSGPPGSPSILSLDIASGPDAGGTTVTITGLNLLGAAVTVGGIAAAVTSNTATQIVITTPPHVAKTVHTVATTSAGPSAKTDADKFTFTASGPPGSATVENVAPAAGPSAGGQTVTITVDSTTGITAVAFDGLAAADLDLIDGTHLSVSSPAHAPGAINITVTNASGPSGINAACVYTYFPPTPSTPASRRWTLLARDANQTPQAAIEDFTALTFIPNWNDVGTWILTIPATSPAASVLAQPLSGIIVLADNQVVFSGPVRDKLRSSQDGLENLVVSGSDDNVWLQARLAHPMPGLSTPDSDGFYGPNVYDTRAGVCSTVLSQYVNVNLGQAAIARRRVPALSLAPDPAIGSSITGNGRWQSLLGMMQLLAIASDPTVSFRILQSGAALIFSCFLPRDLSGSAIFQPQTGTLGDFSYELAGANANYVYAAGAGAEAERLIAEAENGDDINQWGLFEEFLDRRDIGGPATLRQAAVAEVLQQAGIFRTDLGVIDTAGLAWGKDYNLGDRVSVIVDGVRLIELVRSVQVDLGPNGDTETITPSVSSPSRKSTVKQQAAFSIIRDLATRVANLERTV